MIAVLKHELRSAYNSLTVYLFTAALLCFIGVGAMYYNIQAIEGEDVGIEADNHHGHEEHGNQGKVLAHNNLPGFQGQGIEQLVRLLLPLLGKGSHGQQQAMLVTVRHLCRGKCDIHQIFAQGPGEGLFQKAQIHFLLPCLCPPRRQHL